MSINILGVTITNLKKIEVLDRIQNLFNVGKQVLVVTPNPEMLVLASKNQDFKALLNSADIALPDGFGLMLVAWWQGQQIVERITGVDFLVDAARLAKNNNLVVYLLGGKNGAGEATKKVLEKYIPGAEIENNEEEFINNPAKKYMVFTALGHGRQEQVAKELLNKFPNIVLAMGVGGAFDFLSGKIARAPRFLRILGLEWLFRLFKQPWRFKRIWNATVVFLFLILKEKYQKSNF